MSESVPERGSQPTSARASALAFCPHPPLLVPAVAQGAASELDGLRDACRAAIETVASRGPLVLLGGAHRTVPHGPTARGSLAGYGVPLEIGLGPDAGGPAELPLSLTIGAWLVREALGSGSGATAWSVGPELLAADQLPDGAALLVLGDGSARRSTAAPGYLDPRAEPYDAEVVAALAAGDPNALAAAEPDGLLVAGTYAWRAAAAAARGTTWQAAVTYADAPYGVGYAVATWLR